MKKVIVPLAAGFEEIEVVTPVDILRRGDVRVDLASITDSREVEGSRGISLLTDKLLADCQASDYDMIMIPGGPGVEKLRKDSRTLDFILEFHKADKWIGAICAAPLVLLRAGILKGRTLTSYPSVKDDLVSECSAYSHRRVVVDKNLITSRGAGCAEEFAFTLLEALTSAEKVSDIKAKIISAFKYKLR